MGQITSGVPIQKENQAPLGWLARREENGEKAFARHLTGVWDSVVSSPRGQGRSPGRKRVLLQFNLRRQKVTSHFHPEKWGGTPSPKRVDTGTPRLYPVNAPMLAGFKGDRVA